MSERLLHGPVKLHLHCGNIKCMETHSTITVRASSEYVELKKPIKCPRCGKAMYAIFKQVKWQVLGVLYRACFGIEDKVVLERASNGWIESIPVGWLDNQPDTESEVQPQQQLRLGEFENGSVE